ncbi:MAG: PAS domain-containing protein [Acidobacteriota bacterium]|nr:PAS domain-containing protein [Acidobacteriota bacterium]
MPEVVSDLFRSFASALPLAACLVDAQAHVVFWNAAAEALTGYQSHDVLGREYRSDLLIHLREGHGGTETVCPVREVLRNGGSVMAELFLRHKDGHRMPVQAYAFALRGPEGEVLGAGQVFTEAAQSAAEAPKLAHTDREFEWATGLPAFEATRAHLRAIDSDSALILIEMSQQQYILQHGGALLLHQAIRVLARTVNGLLPPHHFLGCWSDGRLLAVVPGCSSAALDELKERLAAVGSGCAVKWWGDRIAIGIRAAAHLLQPPLTAIELLPALERELAAASREE